MKYIIKAYDSGTIEQHTVNSKTYLTEEGIDNIVNNLVWFKNYEIDRNIKSIDYHFIFVTAYFGVNETIIITLKWSK